MYTGESFQVSGSLVMMKLLSSCSNSKVREDAGVTSSCNSLLWRSAQFLRRMPRTLKSLSHCCIRSTIRPLSLHCNLIRKQREWAISGPTYHKWLSSFFSAASATALFMSSYCFMCLYSSKSLTGAWHARGHDIQACTYTWRTTNSTIYNEYN